MALILADRNAVFLHIPKCAGQEIEHRLGHAHKTIYHAISDLPAPLDDFFRFTFVRHPVYRFISMCNYNMEQSLRRLNSMKAKNYDSLSSCLKYRLHLASNRPSLSEIVADLCYGRIHESLHISAAENCVDNYSPSGPYTNSDALRDIWAPQFKWLVAGKPQFIGRVESFENDLRYLFQIIGLKKPPASSIKNASARKHYSSSELSEKDLKLLRRFYKFDFLLCGYEY